MVAINPGTERAGFGFHRESQLACVAHEDEARATAWENIVFVINKGKSLPSLLMVEEK